MIEKEAKTDIGKFIVELAGLDPSLGRVRFQKTTPLILCLSALAPGENPRSSNKREPQNRGKFNPPPPPFRRRNPNNPAGHFGTLIFRQNSFPVAWILVPGPKHTFLLVAV